MFSWCRLNTFDDLLIAFYQPIIFSHYFLLSLSTRTTLYHQSFCPLNGELCLCHSEVNHSQCWSAGKGSPEGRLYQPPISSITQPGQPNARCQLHIQTCCSDMQLCLCSGEGLTPAIACFTTWQKRPGRMERIHVIILQLWALFNLEIQSL